MKGNFARNFPMANKLFQKITVSQGLDTRIEEEFGISWFVFLNFTCFIQDGGGAVWVFEWFIFKVHQAANE